MPTPDICLIVLACLTTLIVACLIAEFCFRRPIAIVSADGQYGVAAAIAVAESQMLQRARDALNSGPPSNDIIADILFSYLTGRLGLFDALDELESVRS